MTCEDAASLISARVDGELAAGGADAVALDAHLAECAECRATWEAVQLQDAALVRAFAPRRAAAEAMAERVTAAMTRAAPPRRTWRPLTIAAAVVIASGAVSVLALKRERPAPPPVARVTLTTGSVFTCPSHAPDQWQTVTPGADLATGARVRTSPDGRAELRLADGSQVRLNGSTEASLGLGPLVELRTGQVWSAVPPHAAPLLVSVEWPEVMGRVTAVTRPGSRVDFACVSGLPVVTAVDGPARVIYGGGFATEVPAGEAATVGGGIDASPRCTPADPLLATRWVDDLLVLKRPDDPELIDRVNQLLARVNAEQAAHAATRPAVTPGDFEQLLRNRGDRWSEPMACYVRSPASQGDREKRLTAARLLSDLAPPSLIPDLIALLADPEPDVRLQVARALVRLTGQDLGRSPEQCAGETGASVGQGQKLWQAWWEASRTRHPGQGK